MRINMKKRVWIIALLIAVLLFSGCGTKAQALPNKTG